MGKTSAVACAYLIFVISFVWGLAAASFEVFPWKLVEPMVAEIKAFSESHPDEPELPPLKKLVSDFGGIPFRYVQENHLPYAPSVTQGEPFSVKEGNIHIRGQFDNPPEGFLAVFGAFRFGNGKNTGMLLFTTDGSLIGGWSSDLPPAPEPMIDLERRWIFSHAGTVMLWDCDHANLDRAVQTRVIQADAHHSIEVSPAGTYWTHIDEHIIELGYTVQHANEAPVLPWPKDFEVLKQFDIASDLVRNTPDISPLTPRFYLHFDKKQDPQKMRPIQRLVSDPFHNNDVEPFQSHRFPTESGYALLVSLREPNLVMVLDPGDGKILWYRQGLTERQHDPDYFDDGVFVYNNRSFKDFSRIDYMPFESDGSLNHGLETIIDGKDHNWFDPSRGQHEVFRIDGQRYHLVVNDRGGRVMMFDDTGEMRLELTNLLGDDPQSTTRLQIRAAKFLTPEQFGKVNRSCAPKS